MFRVGVVNLHIASDVPGILDELASAFDGYPQDTSVATLAMLYEFRLRKCGDFEGLMFWRDKSVYSNFVARTDILGNLFGSVQDRLGDSKATGWLNFAASVAVYRGKGVLFCNSCRSGKSTLMAALLSRGWQHGGDSLSFIDSQTLQTRALPMPVRIRSGSYEVLEAFDSRLAGRWTMHREWQDEAFVNPFLFGEEPIPEPSPIRCVVFPRYIKNAALVHRAVDRDEAMERIMVRLNNPWAFGARAPQLVGRIIDGAKVCALDWSDLGEACDFLTEYVTA